MKLAFDLVIFGLLARLAHAASLVRLPNQHVLVGELDNGDQPPTKLPHEVRKALKKAEIIPTVMDDFVPTLDLKVKWSHGNKASLGNTLKPKDLQDPPSIRLKDLVASTTCLRRSHTSLVVVITDPDAPSRDDPKWSEFCHWIAVGPLVTADCPISDEQTQIHGCCSSVSLGTLEDIVSYTPPAPPEKTGKHRYVILALAPVNGTSEKLHLSKPKERKRWGYDKPVNGKTHGVREWAVENGLVPFAANFIYAQNKKQ
ncbi:phosphatidylethanolamine-binding protein [Neurospora intermedia]|uniref:Phosphatidylethanolamine-binding protein n=1 Tax=Neurospora intermedia TaxID=5142 RepID=A0ABR3CZL9_NEUIN